MSGQAIYFAYSRQSVERAGDRGDSASIADQFRTIEGYADRLGGRIVRRFSDGDTSGATESRDGLDRMLAEVKTIRPAAVIVRDVSRLARDTRIFLTLVDTLQTSGVKLLSATESLEDRTLATVISAISERERLALAGRVAGGVREHARRGKTHGRPAFGYRRLDGAMLVYEPEATVVREIFRRFVAGDSITRVCDWLNTDPTAPDPPEAEGWHHATVAKLLRRPVYAGDVVIAARTDISGRAWPEVVTRDAHPAIVDRATWETAQRLRRDPLPVVRQELVSPLSGLLWCAHCGGRVYAVEQQRAHRPNSVRIARCRTAVWRKIDGLVMPACPGVKQSLALGTVERLARDAFGRLVASMRRDDEIAAAIRAFTPPAQRDGADRARTRLAEIARRRERLLDAYEDGSLDLTMWRGRDGALAAESETLTAVINARPRPPDMTRLLALRATIAAMPCADPDFDVRAVLIELGARATVDFDAPSVVIEPGGDYARYLFAPAVSADT